MAFKLLKKVKRYILEYINFCLLSNKFLIGAFFNRLLSKLAHGEMNTLKIRIYFLHATLEIKKMACIKLYIENFTLFISSGEKNEKRDHITNSVLSIKTNFILNGILKFLYFLIKFRLIRYTILKLLISIFQVSNNIFTFVLIFNYF